MALPAILFAIAATLMSQGLSAGELSGMLPGWAAAVHDPAAIGVVVGKAVGVLGGTWAVARFTRAELDEDLAWTDTFGLFLLAGSASP